jgi:prepilin-type N-terminal cleavage/methylation domain-containing protein
MARRTRQDGFSLIELMIVLVIAAVIMAIAIPMMREALVRGMIGAATAEARTIHNALKTYHVDHSGYPNSAGFDVTSMEPLVTMGYYDGRLLPRVRGGTLDGYDAPSDGDEYWLEFTLRHEPSVRFLVCDSDDAPLAGGTYYDGILMYRSGVLKKL